ncbi:MAG: heavy metal translocating P-type ATPase, partial [Geminicoccales bacterium]
VLKDVRKVVFDKTGTLTAGRPAVVRVLALAGWEGGDALGLAAAVEEVSEHPLARAIGAAAKEANAQIGRAEAFQATPGKGVTARVAGREVSVGSPAFAEQRGADLQPVRGEIERMQSEAQTVIAVVVDERLAAVIAIADPLKPDAADAIARLREAGLEPVMLTGDNQRTAQAVARRLGIEEYHAEVLPPEKAEAIRALQRDGTRVAMVGDGINDAPALMQADVGIAIGAGTDIAIESADVVLVGERLTAVVDAIQIGRASYRKTVQNLALAFSFNGIGVPLATTGLVHPVWAMIAMAASVTAVLTNSFAGRLLPRRGLRERAALEVAVGNMHCEHCVETIRKELLGHEGVDMVTGDPGRKRVTIAYRPEAIGPEGIRRAIRARGYDAA